MMRELVCEHDVDLPGAEPAVEQRVPEHDPARRPEPERERVRLARRVAHPFHPQGDPRDSLCARQAVVPGDETGVARAVEARVRVRRDEQHERHDSGEDRSARDPPPEAESPSKTHHDEQRDRQRDERDPELRPAAEHCVEVAGMRDVVTALPPERDDGEGELDEPDDREAEHAEQHPRADRARRRLARVAAADPRPDGERAQHGEGLERPDQEQQPLVALGTRHERAAEDRVDVDVRERERVGDGGTREEPGEREPRRDERRPDRDARRSHGAAASSSSGRGRSSAGDESGYRAVRRSAYAVTCAW